MEFGGMFESIDILFLEGVDKLLELSIAEMKVEGFLPCVHMSIVQNISRQSRVLRILG